MSETFEGWAILEIMGHRRLAGMVSEQEIAGAAFLRVDVPSGAGEVVATQFYSAAAIYAITPTTEQIARAFAIHHQPAPVTRWDLPGLPAASPTTETEAEDVPFANEPF